MNCVMKRNCDNLSCNRDHPEGRYIDCKLNNNIDEGVIVKPRNYTVNCKYGDDCLDYDCTFANCSTNRPDNDVDTQTFIIVLKN